jgi:hypothetical protein
MRKVAVAVAVAARAAGAGQQGWPTLPDNPNGTNSTTLGVPIPSSTSYLSIPEPERLPISSQKKPQEVSKAGRGAHAVVGAPVVALAGGLYWV